MQLRWYQDESISAIFDYFKAGNKGNPVVALPTGTGKSLVIAGFIKLVMSIWPSQRFMMLTHVKELVEQNANKLIQIWPEAPVGIYSAGLKERDTMHPIIFGSVASVKNNVAAFGHRDLLIVDECHLLSDNNTSMYQQVIAELQAINPKLKVIGLTATPYRMKMGLITDGTIFDDICYNLCDMDGFERLLNEGFLCPPVARVTDTQIDLTNVAVRGGDFAKNDLESAIDISEVTYACVSELVEKGSERHSWLVFASGIDHVEHVAETITAFGIEAIAVHSKMPAGERDRRINMFKTGAVQCIVNNGILTTGFDHPPVDLICMLRPTMSPALWVQMLGRGTRPYDCANAGMYINGFDYQKENCLVLDFAGNTERLGPINDPKVPQRSKKGGGDAPVRICPECGTYNHASARFCGGENYPTPCGCGFEFPIKVKITKHASEKPLIKTREPQIQLYAVSNIEYLVHTKGERQMLKVVYHCGYHSFSEYVNVEHTGFPLRKAIRWWNARELAGGFMTRDVPTTAVEAAERATALPQPSHIKVDTNLKYPEVLDYVYA